MRFDVAALLETRALARNLEHHDVIDSTNIRARELARSGAPHGTCVVAAEQTDGRGRRGRSWHSPPGAGLYVSFVLRPRIAPKDAALLTLTAGVALAEAIGEVSSADVQLKWPNDLLAGPRHGALARRKLCGVLVELSADVQRLDHAVLGIGINLKEQQRPDGIGSYATSLEALGGAPDPARLLATLALRLEERLDTLERYGAAPILAAWNTHAAGLGETVAVDGEGPRLEGLLRGLGPDGALQLETARGLRQIYAGDLHLPGMTRPGDRSG